MTLWTSLGRPPVPLPQQRPCGLEEPTTVKERKREKFAKTKEYIQFLYTSNLWPSQSLLNMINHYRFFLSSLPWPQLISPCSTVIRNVIYEGGKFRALISLHEWKSAVWGPEGKRSNNDRPHFGEPFVCIFCFASLSKTKVPEGNHDSTGLKSLKIQMPSVFCNWDAWWPLHTF